VASDSADVTSSKRSFQVCGLVTRKARLPTGANRQLVLTACSVRRRHVWFGLTRQDKHEFSEDREREIRQKEA